MMEENHTDSVSPMINYYQNNNLKEVKIILDRNIVKSYLRDTNKDLSKYGLQNNGGRKKTIQENNTTGSKMIKRTKFLDKGDYKNSSNTKTSQQSLRKESYSAYKCEICEDSFQTMRALTHHARFHIKSNGVVFTCALCSKTFESNEELINHKKVHDSEDLCFECKKCKVAYTNHHDYMQHNARHVTTPIYKCIECSFTFNTRKIYKNHLSIHYIRQLKCNLCNEIFTQNKDLSRHKRNTHYPGIDCIECGKNVQTKRDYMEHMCIHTGVKIFQCLYCGKGFTQHGTRREHMMKYHTKFIPHECTICSEKFYTTSNLKYHMLIHESETIYECNECARRFAHKNSLLSHVKQHMNIKYKCPMCNRLFKLYQNLLQHTESVHIRIRRYQCEVCELSFILKSTLRKHMRTRKHLNQAYASKMGLLNK